MLLPSEKIYLDKSPIAGRGVFAKVKIKKGEVIEVAPVIVIPSDQAYSQWSEIYRYVFGWGVEEEKTVSLAMGFGSFYNHSDDPNATYKILVLQRVIEFIAVKDIEKDEEILVNYGYKIPKEYERKY